MLLVAILAFVPVLSSSYLLDGYVRSREAPLLLQSANRVSGEAQSAVYEAMQIISEVRAATPSVCTNSFLNFLAVRMQRSIFVRQILVENQAGVRYCEAIAGEVEYESLSEPVSIPGREETVSSVRIPGLEVPGLKISRFIDENKTISAIVKFNHIVSEGRLPIGLRDASLIRVSFTDGNDLLTIGDSDDFDDKEHSADYVTAVAFAGDVPIRVEVAVPFSSVRAQYGELYIWLTVLACLFSAGVLIAVIHAVRKARLPSFDLEHAIASGDIKPFYQPIVDISTGRLYGCEVLARWVKPNGDTISPAVFIEYAEVSGLAIPMTISLMEAVRRDLEDLFAAFPDMRVSINLFEGHFRDGSVVEDVSAIFSDSKISFRQLVFEITERHPLGDDTQAKSVINGLHAMGCRLAMDDVGTGHSNLAYIQKLGLDIIKIDRVFIDPITEASQSFPVLDSLINMAHDLGAGIIAEGVETEEQALYLRSKGVKNIQGYLFSPAIPARKFCTMARTLNGLAGGAKSGGGDIEDQFAA